VFKTPVKGFEIGFGVSIPGKKHKVRFNGKGSLGLTWVLASQWRDWFGMGVGFKAQELF